MNPKKSTRVNIPEKVPVFPLPNTVLLPHSELPLYIFEPRYRKMLTDCLAGNKFLAISLLRKGWENKTEPVPSHNIVGVGYVRAVFQNPDGTSHILLKGVARARIVRYLKMDPYRIAKIQEVPDQTEQFETLKKLSAKFQKLVASKLRFESETPDIPVKLPREIQDPSALSYFAAGLMKMDIYLKQDFLETTNSECRIQHLIDLLQETFFPPGSEN